MATKAQFVKSLLLSILCLTGVEITVASAAISDHFNNGALDPEWNVSFNNASGWTYAESGTNLSVTDIGVITSGSWSDVFLRQDFSAPGNFEIKFGFSWDSESTLSTMQTLGIRAYSGSKIVTECGYIDSWIDHNGGKFARIEYPNYSLDSGRDTLPFSGSVEVTLKRINDSVSVLWNDDVILTGHSNSAVDKIELLFSKNSYTGSNFGVLSVDYVTAVPEPATLILFGAGIFGLLRRR